MKVLLHSNASWCPTGYGCQSKFLIDFLKRSNCEILFEAYWGIQGGVLEHDGVLYLPSDISDNWGWRILPEYAERFNIDYVLSLCDVFTSPIEVGQGYKWIAYTPIDTVEATSAITRRLTNAYFVPCVTHYTEQIIKEAVPQVRTSYCPHCVDTSKYYIKNKKECKEKLNFTEDDYVFGMIAMNKGVIPRKSFPQILEAFAKIHKKYPQTKMYLHTITDRAMQDSVDINMILNENGILSAARRADPFRILIGYSDEDMCVIYNALDCMILCSLGEGFGIPLIEAQACGTPVLTQDYGPQAELCKVGWKVKAGPDYWTHLCGHWKMPLVDDIYDKMEQAINSHITERTRKEARKAIVEEYDCNVVYKKSWKPLFEQLEKELHD